MIWRSSIVFLASFTAATLPVAGLQAQSIPLLLAESSVVDPDAAIDTGQTTPGLSSTPSGSPLSDVTSEEQIQEIKILQQELKNRGYYDGPIDGIYGPMTETAIRELRGRTSGQTDLPSTLFPASTAPVDTPAETASLGREAPIAAEPGADDNSVDIAAENVAEDAGEINLGDTVSPETGVDESSPEESPEAPDAGAATQAQPTSPGLGRLLWPGLALIVAFGSFGIGFLLANRVKSEGDETESPWGVVPDPLPQPPPPSPLLNGHVVANNGTGSRPATDSITHHQSEPSREDLSLVSNAGTVSATTRLAKVDVIDELVANLQVSDPSKRRKAIWELGQRGNSSAVQHLVNGMVDADSKEKSLILAALSEIGIRSLKPMNRALAIALQDENPDVRKNAIRDLTRVYDQVTQISQMLGHATEDTDPEVRRTAEWALEQLNRIREAPKLKSSLNALETARSTPELLPDEVENLTN